MPIHRRYETSGFTSLHEAGAPYGLPVILNKFLRIKILSITHLAAIFCRERPFIFNILQTTPGKGMERRFRGCYETPVEN